MVPLGRAQRASACLLELSTCATHTPLGLSLVPRTEASAANLEASSAPVVVLRAGPCYSDPRNPQLRPPLQEEEGVSKVKPSSLVPCRGGRGPSSSTKASISGDTGRQLLGEGGWKLDMQSVRPCRVWGGGERRAEHGDRQAPFLLHVAPKNVEEAEGLHSSVGL